MSRALLVDTGSDRLVGTGSGLGSGALPRASASGHRGEAFDGMLGERFG